MSERLTSIRLLTHRFAGWAEWGRKTPAEMIAAIRSHAQHQLAEAQAVLAAADEDFYIDTYRGVHVQRDREVLQEGKK